RWIITVKCLYIRMGIPIIALKRCVVDAAKTGDCCPREPVLERLEQVDLAPEQRARGRGFRRGGPQPPQTVRVLDGKRWRAKLHVPGIAPDRIQDWNTFVELECRWAELVVRNLDWFGGLDWEPAWERTSIHSRFLDVCSRHQFCLNCPLPIRGEQ